MGEQFITDIDAMLGFDSDGYKQACFQVIGRTGVADTRRDDAAAVEELKKSGSEFGGSH